MSSKEAKRQQAENSLNRELILQDPTILLDDRELMDALVAASEATRGDNVVDLRTIAMGRLEKHLDRLERTHRTVVSTAYENLVGMDQLHRAIVRLINTYSLAEFAESFSGPVKDILNLDAALVCAEPSAQALEKSALEMAAETSPLTMLPAGDIQAYISAGEAFPARQVSLRRVRSAPALLYGDLADDIQSEALLHMPANGKAPACLLVMGSKDEEMFSPDKGTDLLTFLADAAGGILKRWLN